MKLFHASLAVLCALAAAKDSKPLKPCTIRSPSTDRFFDLNPIHRHSKPKDADKPADHEGSWHAKGYDYGANFTLNFCGPVVEELEHVVDLDKSLWKNVSAYYEVDDKVYAIGLANQTPVFRGRKLVLNYTDGSLCPAVSSHRLGHDDDDDDDRPRKSRPSKSHRRKSTVISLLCESDPSAKTSIAFVAASEDECTYFFEARSPSACGGVEAETTLGPGGVFGVIVLIAVLVYLAGGCVYQRTVMHQRGWRQIPNYTMWAGLFEFGKDMFVILTSSCARFLPSRRGYSRVSLGPETNRRGRRNEDENRLIDNLDEEWDD